MDLIAGHVRELQEKLQTISHALDIGEKKNRINQLLQESSNPDFWRDQEKAKQTMIELSGLQETQETVDRVNKLVLSLESVDTISPEQGRVLLQIKKDLEALEIQTFLSNTYDKESVIISIHAGQGGTEAMDWAEMLERMYIRYAQKKGWNVVVADRVIGEEAGVKSATLIVEGSYAYGYLKGEAGTHRLVRQSPFNADKLRQTSFALVEVLPQMPENEEADVKEDDLEWQFFRSSSQGGQNVQKVSTAVRLTHKPTGITVTAQSERYQEQNRKIALRLLAAKLWVRQQEEMIKTQQELKGEYHPASWGTQIRSYILHPYKMVKDLRTGVETSAAEDVLNGELEDFITAQVRM